MCVVNDFLDRVTAKAIGNEAMLTPRLPSLFEPQAASIIPATFGTSAIEEQGNAQAVTNAADAAHRDPAMEHSPSSLEARLNGAARKQAQSQPYARRRSASRAPTPPAIETTLRSSDVAVEELTQPTTTDRTRHHATPGEPVEPRASRVSSEPQTPSTIARPSETGALLPPAKPVFVSTKNLGDLPARAAEAMHSHPIGPAGHRAEQSEPVVHVSIGRLEVRAAPNSTTIPTRRNDAPRPSSLDDYLRQRGKAVP
jgi:hypothetical protein